MATTSSRKNPNQLPTNVWIPIRAEVRKRKPVGHKWPQELFNLVLKKGSDLPFPEHANMSSQEGGANQNLELHSSLGAPSLVFFSVRQHFSHPPILIWEVRFQHHLAGTFTAI